MLAALVAGQPKPNAGLVRWLWSHARQLLTPAVLYPEFAATDASAQATQRKSCMSLIR
jgi:hypothetical protein